MTSLGAEEAIRETGSLEALSQALFLVSESGSLRIRPGIQALRALLEAPDHCLPRAEIEHRYGPVEQAFHWFCRRVADELQSDPGALTLVDESHCPEGRQVWTLKSAVVAALCAPNLGSRQIAA
jgi:hypothetical protein